MAHRTVGRLGLERLTEPADLVQADEGCGEGHEGEVDVVAALVADGEAAEAGHPREGSFDNPAVAAEALGAVDAGPGDARGDAALAQDVPHRAAPVGLVGVQLLRPSARPAAPAAAHRRDGVEGGLGQPAVVPVGRAERQAERRALGVGEDAVLRARLAPVGRVRAGLRTPLFAGTDLLSSAARSQRMRPAACSRSSSTSCSRAHTPAACQSRSRRQQVMPDPQPISTGSRSHGVPVTSTNRMPVSAARSGRRGRPPFGFGRSGGSSGATAAQRSSETRGFAMPAPTRQSRFR